MPQLDPTWFASQLFWLAISFMVLYVLISRVILPPLMKVIGEREDKVNSDLSMAQSYKTQSAQAKDKYEKTMAEARAKAQQLLDDAMLEHKNKAEEAEKKLEQDITAKLREAEERIGAKKQELMTSLEPATNELTATIVEKLLSQKPETDTVATSLKRVANEG